MTVTIEFLRQSIDSSAALACQWFEAQSAPKTRETFFARGQLGDVGSGAVYVYYSAEGCALYVGQTGRTVKSRQHDETSPHKLKEWWNQWVVMRFVNVEDHMDRLKLEFMLILACRPKYNLAHTGLRGQHK